MRPIPICAVCALLTAPTPSAGALSPPTATLEQPTAGPAATSVAGVLIPGSRLAREAAEVVRRNEGELLFRHSMRVYCWAALAARRKGFNVDPELLFIAAMFHDFGLTADYSESHLRYEVDGADAAAAFLRRHRVPADERQKVWLAIALHTTNGIPAHVSPLADLVAEGANMDLVGLGYGEFTPAERNAVERAYPRESTFAAGFLDALYNGLKHRPETTQGTGLADVMALKDPQFRRRDFSTLMRSSPWTAAAH